MQPNALLDPLLQRATLRTYPPKTLILSEGDEGTSLLLVLSGRLKVFTSDSDGKQFTLAMCQAGDFVGELALDGSPRCASVMTLEKTVCAVVPHDLLRKTIQENPDFAIALILRLVQRTRNATHTAKGLALGNVYQRIAELVNVLSEQTDYPRKLKEKLTRQAIADRVGASRDMTRRVLVELVSGGYLDINGRDIRLLKSLPHNW